ncbi:hypothetical protein D3C87_1459940 [compost metagenome]
MVLAQSHIESLQALESDLQASQLMLCGLEKKGLLAFDDRWVETAKLEVPEPCLTGRAATSFINLRIRSSSIAILDPMNPWDQKLEVRSADEKPHTLYLRQDNKYVGAHSSKGWSVWIERKTGKFRFEYGNVKNSSHLRLQGTGSLHPLKGDLQKLENLEALHVSNVSAKLKANVVKITRAGGFKLWTFEKQDGKWQGTKKICNRPESCDGLGKLAIDESLAQQFVQIDNSSYQVFLEKGHPLAFQKIEASELVPRAAPYR